MSDPSVVDDQHESPNVRQMRERIKALEEVAKAADEYRDQAERFQRELAIRDADLDLNVKQRRALFSVHEGEFTPDALRATATELGFGGAPTDGASQVPDGELARLKEIQSASAGAPPGSVTQSDSDRDFYARLAQAKSEKEFDEIYRSSGRPIVR